MPAKTTKARAAKAARSGKKPTTQAGEFVREKMHKLKRGDRSIKSKKQAVAIGLSEARRSGVKLSPPKKGKASAKTRQNAKRDLARGQGRARTSPSRSRGAKKAAATRKKKAVW